LVSRASNAPGIRARSEIEGVSREGLEGPRRRRGLEDPRRGRPDGHDATSPVLCSFRTAAAGLASSGHSACSACSSIRSASIGRNVPRPTCRSRPGRRFPGLARRRKTSPSVKWRPAVGRGDRAGLARVRASGSGAGRPAPPVLADIGRQRTSPCRSRSECAGSSELRPTSSGRRFPRDSRPGAGRADDDPLADRRLSPGGGQHLPRPSGQGAQGNSPSHVPPVAFAPADQPGRTTRVLFRTSRSPGVEQSGRSGTCGGAQTPFAPADGPSAAPGPEARRDPGRSARRAGGNRTRSLQPRPPAALSDPEGPRRQDRRTARLGSRTPRPSHRAGVALTLAASPCLSSSIR